MADEQLTRRQWRKGAVKALLASTTPSGRFLMLRAGFFHFQTIAQPVLKAVADHAFTSSDLRRIYDDLAKHVFEHERHLQARFEKKFLANLHKDRDVPSAPSETPGDGITVESAGTGMIH